VDGSVGKEASSGQLRISKSIARRIDAAGAGREVVTSLPSDNPPNGFVLDECVRTTVVDPGGGSEINKFEPIGVRNLNRQGRKST
jgi:hypothetical protein